MMTITDRNALRRAIRDPALAPPVRAILALRHDQLGGDGAHFHVAQAGDGIADAELAIGFPLTLDGETTCEWIERHPGDVLEAVLILSDDGPAQVLLVSGDACPAVADLLREHAAS